MAKKTYGGYKNLHQDKTGLYKHREWRGFKDTLVDYWRWLVTWKDMIVMVLKNPVAVAKGCGDIAGWRPIFQRRHLWIVTPKVCADRNF